MQRVISVTGKSGHETTLYRTDADLAAGERLGRDEKTEDEARAVFFRIMSSNVHGGPKRVPFAVEADKSLRELKEFDPNAQEITFVSQIAGG